MDEFIVKGGKWKLYENNQLFDGEFSFNPETDDAVLEILMLSNQENIMPKIPYKGKIPYVTGTLFTGTKALLYNCQTGSHHTHLMSHTQVFLYPDIVFWGLHADSEDEIIFSKIEIDFGEIIEWSKLCRYECNLNEDGTSNLYWVRENAVVLNLREDVIIKFYPVQGTIGSNEYSTSITANQKIIVEFEYASPKTIETILEDVKNIQYLIGLGTRANVRVSSAKYYHPSIYTEYTREKDTKEKILRPADFFISNEKLNDNSNRKKCDFLYTLEDIKSSIILDNWAEKYSVIKPILDLYFTVYTQKAGTAEILFLNLTQALETYHARFITDCPKTYAERVEKIVEEFCNGNVNTEMWINFLMDNHQKKNKKRLFLRSRIADLVFAEGKLPFNPSGYSKSDYIDKLISTRNYYTHYDPRKLNKSFNEIELPKINGHLLALLEYHILILLGFDVDETRQKIVRKISDIDIGFDIRTKVNKVKT